jgi:hypothetical protein
MPVFTKYLMFFFARGAHLVGGNCMVQLCGYVDPFNFSNQVSKGEGQARIVTDLIFGKRPSPPGEQVNTQALKQVCQQGIVPKQQILNNQCYGLMESAIEATKLSDGSV